ncbi:MAG: acyl-CoA dehydrogenase [Desulfobacteraceae bacterium]|nr:MAG: acyl-CoA dehydrogenase [Desulfobacteraceae bacterium]
MTDSIQARFQSFTQTHVAPLASRHDRLQCIDPELVGQLAAQGYLGAIISEPYKGLGLDMPTFGLLNYELNKSCTAVRSLVTVQNMVGRIIERWGNAEQKDQWLPVLAAGEKIAGFALTEPEYGSDAAGIRTCFTDHGDTFAITGTKKWISFGQMADLFLVFGQAEERLGCLIVEKDTPGLSITPISDILGARGTMLAQLEFDACSVPKENLVTNLGFGLHPVAFTGLDLGRYSIAWGCVGMAAACLEASVTYASERRQFGSCLKDHQLIQALISDMTVDIKAAKLLCEHAGRLAETNDRNAMQEMLCAKYFAAGMVNRVTAKALELHGANGYAPEQGIERFFRDAKIMETIEGSNQMMQIMIAKYGIQHG